MSRTQTRISDITSKFRFRSLYIRNFTVTALLILLPLLALNIFLYRAARRLVVDEASSLSLGTLTQTRDVFDAIFKEGEYIAASISLQEETELYVLTKNYDDILARSAVQTISDSLKTVVYSNTYIHSIYVYSAISDRIVTHIGENNRSEFPDKTWYTEYLTLNEDRIFRSFRTRANNFPYFISLIKPLYLFGMGKKYGAIVINFDVDELTQVLAGEGRNSVEHFLIVDKNGKAVFSTNDAELGHQAPSSFLEYSSFQTDHSSLERSAADQPHIVSTCRSASYPWTFISIHALGEYQLQSTRMQHLITIAILVSLCTTILAAFLISANTYRPIKKILKAIERPEEIQLISSPSKQKLSDETRFIAATIARFANSNSELRRELNSQLTLLDRARAAALQSQINPHFINNTLEIISMSARRLTSGENDVSRMISLLSRLMEAGLDLNENVIPLAEEIEYSKIYLDILSLRYQKRFSVEWEVDETVSSCGMLKLSIQPLLENAFYHGIKPKRTKGNIRISIQKEEDVLVTTVHDSGGGISAHTLRKLNGSMKSEFSLTGPHVGMRNVNQRIKLVFGTQYGVSIDSPSNTETVVTMRTPGIGCTG